MTVGYHCEGLDYLILHRLLCRLCGMQESAVGWVLGRAEPASVEAVLRIAGEQLAHFHGLGVAVAVLAVDNDGRPVVRPDGAWEDPARPRHWLHERAGRAQCADCRLCQLEGVPRPPGAPANWPVVVCVPVEAIEAWVAIARGIVDEDDSLLDAENRSAGTGLKELVYGAKQASKTRVCKKALPVLDRLGDVRAIGKHSESFRLLAEQVDRAARALKPGRPA